MTATVTTIQTADTVAVPRKLVTDAARVLDEIPAGGPHLARELRSFVNTPARAASDLDAKTRWTELVVFAREVADEEPRREVVDAVLATWAPGVGHDQWDDFVEDVRLLAALETGEADWRYHFPELSEHRSVSPEEIAVMQQRELVESQAWLMIHPGRRQCVDCARRTEFPAPAVRMSDRCGPCGTRHELGVASVHDIRSGRPA